MASLTSGSDWSMVLPASEPATSMSSARRAARTSPTRCRAAARSAGSRDCQTPAASAVEATRESTSAFVARRAAPASTSATPRVEPGMAAAMSRAHWRLAARAGSESDSETKGLLARSATVPVSSGMPASRSASRFWVRLGTGTGASGSRSDRAARKRSRSRAKICSLLARSKTPDMKFSGAAFSSRRRTR